LIRIMCMRQRCLCVLRRKHFTIAVEGAIHRADDSERR
jgi:hypothetical protein